MDAGRTEFRCSWSRTVWVVTVLICALVPGFVIGGVIAGRNDPRALWALVSGAILVGLVKFIRLLRAYPLPAEMSPSKEACSD